MLTREYTSDLCLFVLQISGVNIPLLISSPDKEARKNEVTNSLTSHLDIVPTVLDWFNISISDYSLSGKSLLPLLHSGMYYF